MTVLLSNEFLQQSGHHLGPKEFSLDRMMAIFYSIVTETLPPLTSLYSQVNMQGGGTVILYYVV